MCAKVSNPSSQKKSIFYKLTANVPELAPFLFFLLLQIPLPLSTFLILAIDLGTDMYPAIAMAYEPAEADIMRRRPRDAATDRLVSGTLVRYSYLVFGVTQAVTALFCYFVVMAEHGFLPARLVGLRSEWDNTDMNSLADSYGREWVYGCCC